MTEERSRPGQPERRADERVAFGRPGMAAGVDGPPLLAYESLLETALKEDLGAVGDLTTSAIVPRGARSVAYIVAREGGTVAGLGVALRTFALLEAGVESVPRVADGDRVSVGTVLAVVRGDARAILVGERIALNLLGRLCGIATRTRALVDAVAHTPAHIVDTRKTTPGMRALEKYAVRCGGGRNHRFGLHDAVLIKDNHIVVAGGVLEAIQRVRRSVGHMVRIEVEVDTLAQLDRVLEDPVDAVLLDNMTVEELREAVRRIDGRMTTEASGGITLDTAAEIAASGVDLLSVGAITHSAPALDVALDVRAGGVSPPSGSGEQIA